VLQVCCGVLQCGAVETPLYIARSKGKFVDVCVASVLKLVAVGCRGLQCVAISRKMQRTATH